MLHSIKCERKSLDIYDNFKRREKGGILIFIVKTIKMRIFARFEI